MSSTSRNSHLHPAKQRNGTTPRARRQEAAYGYEPGDSEETMRKYYARKHHKLQVMICKSKGSRDHAQVPRAAGRDLRETMRKHHELQAKIWKSKGSIRQEHATEFQEAEDPEETMRKYHPRAQAPQATGQDLEEQKIHSAGGEVAEFPGQELGVNVCKYHELQAKIWNSQGSIRQEEKLQDGFQLPVRDFPIPQASQKPHIVIKCAQEGCWGWKQVKCMAELAWKALAFVDTWLGFDHFT